MSGIAARWMMAAAKRASTPTARDYAQDGLVAMWDGIENAGWGQHDASVTAWTELIGNIPLPVSRGSCSWTDNALTNSTGSAATLASRKGTDSNGALLMWWQSVGIFGERVDNSCNMVSDYTIELVCSVDPISSARVVGMQFYAVRELWEFNCILSSGKRLLRFPPANNWNNTAAQGAVVTQSGIISVSGIARVSAGGELFAGGSQIQTGTSAWPTNRPYDPRYATTFEIPNQASIYCYRLYSRALTAAEVAANYAIDQQRFGV